MKKEIKIKDLIITVEEVGDQDYVSLTDIAKQSERRSGDVIRDWLRNSQTLIFLEEWEKIHNPNFKGGHMPPFRLAAQKNRTTFVDYRIYKQNFEAIQKISEKWNRQRMIDCYLVPISYPGHPHFAETQLTFEYWKSLFSFSRRENPNQPKGLIKINFHQ